MGEATGKIAARLGRKGGKATLAKYGVEHFRKMRAKGLKKWRQEQERKKITPTLEIEIGGI